MKKLNAILVLLLTLCLINAALAGVACPQGTYELSLDVTPDRLVQLAESGLITLVVKDKFRFNPKGRKDRQNITKYKTELLKTYLNIDLPEESPNFRINGYDFLPGHLIKITGVEDGVYHTEDHEILSSLELPKSRLYKTFSPFIFCSPSVTDSIEVMELSNLRSPSADFDLEINNGLDRANSKLEFESAPRRNKSQGTTARDA